MGFAQYLLFAFVGGVILNVMPCVLPVLTLKAFHVVDTLRAHPEKARIHGIAYGVGTTLVFSIFAVLVIILRASGKSMGWGMQFQHPEFVAALVIALHLFGLNALGVFEITISTRGGEKEGVLGSIGNGMLAAVMSMPCTAPFLGSAAAFAMGTNASAIETFLLFAAIGVGLAFPFAALSFAPALIRMLPRPGPWMESFKHIMGFTLIGAAVWLFGSLQSQLSTGASNRLLMFLLVLTIGLWTIQRFGNVMHAARRRWLVRTLAISGVVLFWFRFVQLEQKEVIAAVECAEPANELTRAPVVDDEIDWVPFSEKAVTRAAERGQPILLDFTADWCTACKALEATVMDTGTIRKRLVEYGIMPMQGDYTNADPTIEKWIQEAGRSGIPLVMVIDRSGEHHLLPQVFDVSSLEDMLDKVQPAG